MGTAASTGAVIDLEATPDDVAAWAATAPLTEGVLTPFGVLDPQRLSQDGRIDALAALERVKAWADAQQARILAAAAAQPAPVPAPRGRQQQYAMLSLQQEVACALRWSAAVTAGRFHTATVLVNLLPDTLATVESGALSYLHARSLVDAVDDLTGTGGGDTPAPAAALAGKLERRVLPTAGPRSLAEFRHDLRRAVAVLDPRGAQQQHDAQASERRVCYQPDRHAMAWLNSYLPAVDAQTIMIAVQALADKMTAAADLDDARTADQYRADALTAICAAVLNGDTIDGLTLADTPTPDTPTPDTSAPVTGGPDTGDPDASGNDNGGSGAGGHDTAAPDTAAPGAGEAGNSEAGNSEAGSSEAGSSGSGTARPGTGRRGGFPRWQGRRPSIQVSIALSTLLGLDDQPADLDGYGPIPAQVARRIAADPTGTWHRLLTDPQGRLLDYGRSTYRPPPDLRDYVLARDRTCRGPGCHRNSRRCDLDHITDWAHGGHTKPDNLAPQCQRSHYLKHDAGWDVQRLPDGTTRWTSPTGRHYDKPPDHYPIDHTRSQADTATPTTPIADDAPPF